MAFNSEKISFVCEDGSSFSLEFPYTSPANSRRAKMSSDIDPLSEFVNFWIGLVAPT
jgi:hypothetical protein